MRGPLVLLPLLVALLAGCSSSGGEQELPPADFEELDLVPTATTGIIRGVVVDDAVRPIADATLTLQGAGGTRTTQSAEDGAFGFDGLEPGTYFIQATKVGYNGAQSSADVVAGVAEPPIVKVLLVKDPTLTPFHEVYKWDGFIQCSTRFVVNALAACSVLDIADPSLSQDNFTYRIHPSRVPEFAQSEMVWESTQALGDGMKVQYTDDSDGLDNYVIAVGGSPLLISANQSLMEDKNVGDEDVGLFIRIFAGSVDGTTPPACPPGPCEGVSVVINQSFTVYTVLFHHYLPPEGWRFSVDGEPVPPA